MSKIQTPWTIVAVTVVGMIVALSASSAVAQNQQDQNQRDQNQQDSSFDSPDTASQRGIGNQDNQRQSSPGQDPQFQEQENEARFEQDTRRGRRQDAPEQGFNDRNERNFRDQSGSQYRGQEAQSDSQRGDRQQSNAPAGLGVSVVEGDRGLLVREVAPDSPAEQAGIRRGDEILSVNGRRINDGDQLVRMITRENPGSEVEIEIDRDGRQSTVVANLERRSEALRFENRQVQDRGREQRWSQDEFVGGDSPPWDSQDVQRHVDALEQQVRRMQQEIDDLRRMLQDDPSQRQFGRDMVRGQSTPDSRRNRSQQNQQSDFDRDQQNRARPNYDDANRN